MAVFGAVIAYILQMASFIVLCLRSPHIKRPWRSPIGLTGAVVAAAIALATLCALGAAIWFLGGIVWFACRGRDRLVFAPEEQFAEEHGTSSLPNASRRSQTHRPD